MADLQTICLEDFCSDIPSYEAGNHIEIQNGAISTDFEPLKYTIDVETAEQEGSDPLTDLHGVSQNDVENNVVTGLYAHAEGRSTTASGEASHAEGGWGRATGARSHVEGQNCDAIGANSHAEGQGTTASGIRSHAEGQGTTASGGVAHAEGLTTTASGNYSHAEGLTTTASGEASHAEGQKTTASGDYSHAEGYNTIASHPQAHAEGDSCQALQGNAHAEGNLTKATGNASHANGVGTIANGYATTAIGMWNKSDPNGDALQKGRNALTIGNGTSDSNRVDAFVFRWGGDMRFLISTSAGSGVDYDLYQAITNKGWQNEVVIDSMVSLKILLTKIINAL